MTITRSNAASYLDSQFANLASEIVQAATDDSATGYGPDIDAALRRMDVAEADLAAATVEDVDRVEFYALCDFTCLSRMARRLATRVDSGALVPEGDRQKVFENVKALLDAAAATIEAYGYTAGTDTGGDSGGAAAWGYLDVNTDWVEPGGTVEDWIYS